MAGISFTPSVLPSPPQVTKSYFRRDAATRLAKMYDADGLVWHRMGDLAYKDADGRLWFCGRKSHRVVTTHGTFFTIPCEGVFNTHDLVSRTALVKVGNKPVLCVEPVRPLSHTEKLRVENDLRMVAKRFAHTTSIETFLFHKSFPVDIRHNAKIFREKLQVWAAQCLPSQR